MTNFSEAMNLSTFNSFGPPRDSLYIVIPITIIYTLIFITGLLGNIFTCLVIVRNKSMHTATNYYLFSLAISDLLLLISGMPQEMYSIWSKWPYVFGHSFCVIRGLAAETSTNASILTITLFTAERYLAICHPFVSHKMSKLSRATKHVLLLWVVALGLALPQALQFGIKDTRGVTMCLQTRVIIEHSFEISTFVFFFAPMVLITVLYAFIGLKLRESSVKKEENQNNFEWSIKNSHKLRRKHSQSTKRVVKMLVAVVVAFFICWAPFHAQRLVAIYGTTEHHEAKSPIFHSIYSFLTYISGVFYYISTCINPIFYHIMSNKFRDAFKNTMLNCCRSGDRNATQRCSYTAMAFARNRNSSGTANSGNSQRNSLRQESNNRFNLRRQQSRESYVPTVHVCHNGTAILTTPVQDCEDKPKEHSPTSTENNDNKNNNYPDIALCTVNEICTPSSPECGINPSTAIEITASPETVVLENNTLYLKDDPEEYHKEIKLKIVQREKEYG